MADEASHAPSRVRVAAEAAAAAALASILRTSCTIIDMGSFLLNDVRSRPYTADDAALPCIAGEHVRQILPEALVERAAGFPPFDRHRQACYKTWLSTCAASASPQPHLPAGPQHLVKPKGVLCHPLFVYALAMICCVSTIHRRHGPA